MSSSLVELDCLEVLVIVDNEVDPMSKYQNPGLLVSGRLIDIALTSPHYPDQRGKGCRELQMNSLCCGAHGLSLMITAMKGDKKRTILFDTAPEEHVWELNAKRLQPDLASIDLIHLSHWHRDHSGGMLRAIRMINDAKSTENTSMKRVTVDLHPSRPDYRGMMVPGFPVSLEADPSFEEIGAAGAIISKNSNTHTALDDMFLISGEIPRQTSYELGLKGGIRFDCFTRTWSEDTLILDERFLMCKLKDRGIVLFTGCSHAGVINASKHAVELGGGSPLYAVVGGFHLADAEAPQLHETVQDFKALFPKLLLPGHCSGWRVKCKIEQEMPGCLAPLTVGTKFTF